MSTTAVLVLVLMSVCSNSAQPSVGDSLKTQLLQSVLDSLTKAGAVDISADNGTSSATAPRIPGTIQSIIGFLAARGHQLNVDIGTRPSNNSTETSWSLNVNTSRLLDTLLSSFENSSESLANVTSGIDQTDLTTQSSTTISSSSPTSTSPSSRTTANPTTERPHFILRTSTMAHVPDWDVPHGDPTRPQPDHDQPITEKNPIIEQVDEPIEPSTDEDIQRGSLPLVLGAAIVVIFGAGVAGTAIATACRRRRMASKDSVSDSSSSSGFEEGGIDNPMFTKKSSSQLILVNSAFPPNWRLYRDMRNPSLTSP